MTRQRICKGCKKEYTITKWNIVYCSQKCYKDNGLCGVANPFYGKTHTKETILKLKEDDRLSHKGQDNPFYGKTHSKEIIEAIKSKNEIWRLNNKDLRLQRRLEKKGLTRESLVYHWEIYKNSPVNRSYFKDIVGVDIRTFKKFLIDCDLATKEELDIVTEQKQMFQCGYSISSPELNLFSILKQCFGESNVKHQFKKFGFWFDFCLFDKIIIEYDGFYYHKILINKNDSLKETLALSGGYQFVRVEEDENRKVDWAKSLENIKEVVKRINL